MSKILELEASALFVALMVLVLVGGLTGYWGASIGIASGGYVIWIYNRLRKLEKWLRRGSKVSEVYDDDGFIGLIIRHVYHQKKNWNERKKRTKDILGRLNRNISALPDATVLLDEYYQIEWCNEPATYLLKINPRADLGQRISNLIRAPEFLDYLHHPGQKNYLEIESPGDHDLAIQVKVVRFGNNQYLLTARNISDQKQLQDGLKKFVANASHELRSPLTVISGHLEMLEGETGLSEQGVQSLATARKQSARMLGLIENLLLLSQVESYQLQPHEGEELDIAALMARVFLVLEENRDFSRIDYTGRAGLTLSGIGVEIESICINLVQNALQYSRPGTPVKVSWQQNSLGETVFSVADSGKGIDGRDLPHITTRYYRGTPQDGKPVQGSGLGLSIVKHAVAKHGAVLDFVSRRNQGSTFKVIFPSYRSIYEKKRMVPTIGLVDY